MKTSTQELKRKCDERIELFRRKSESEIESFKNKLWYMLIPDFLDVMREIGNHEHKTESEKSLLNSLKDILVTCEENGVIPKT